MVLQFFERVHFLMPTRFSAYTLFSVLIFSKNKASETTTISSRNRDNIDTTQHNLTQPPDTQKENITVNKLTKSKR